MKQEKDYIYDISLCLLSLMTFIIIVTSILFLVGISISYFNFIVPFLITISFIYYKKQNIKETIFIVGISMIVFWACILMSGSVFDNTWDGAAYHKQAIGLLKEGWNPVYLSATQFNDFSQSILNGGDNPFLWAEVYPKATWYFASVVYYITGNIESGKAYTFISMLVLFGNLYDYLKCKMSKREAGLIAIVSSFHPIALAQIQTYYLDGMVAMVLINLIIISMMYLDENYKRDKKEIFIHLIFFILVGCNLKWSVTLFLVTYLGIFMLIVFVNKNKQSIKIFITLLCSGLISIFIIGFAPFITNYIRYQNLFEGFISDSGGVIGGINETFGIDGLNNAEMFLISLFGKMSHGEYQYIKDVLKIPFTVYPSELDWYSIPDTHIGGFGIFFGGIFLISILILIFYTIKTYKSWKSIHQYAFLVVFVSLIEMLILPGTFNARYIPQLYIVIIFALIGCHQMSLVKIKYIKKLISLALILLLFLNNLPWGKIAILKIKESINTREILRNMADEENWEIAFYCDDFNGIHYNLKDFGINYESVSVENVDDSYKTTFFNWIYYKQ